MSASSTPSVDARAARGGPKLVRAPSAVACGARLGQARLLVRPFWLIALLCVSLAATAGWIERSVALPGAVDRALGEVFRLVVPLLAFLLVNLTVGARRLGDSVWGAARFGLSRRKLAFGLVLSAMAASAAVAVVAVELTVVVAGPGPLGLGRELWTSGWIAALSAATYAAWFAAGSTWLRAGRGRWIPLAADFTLGMGSGLWAVPWPRPHVRSLVGDLAPLDLPQPVSAGWLLLSALGLALAASLRCRD